MPIEKLISLPNHQKVEDGYAYDPKFVGKVFIHGTSLIYFKEKSMIEWPLEIVNAIRTLIFDELDTKLNTLSELISTNKELTDQFEKNIQKRIDEFDTEFKTISANSKTYVKRQEEFIDFFETFKKILVTKETIDENIDKKLIDVYNNFKDVASKLVTESVSNALKDSKRDQTGKLKISTIAMMKEMHLSIEEIVALTKEGLI